MGRIKHVVACIPFARDYVFIEFFKSWTRMFAYARGKYDLSPIFIVGPYIDLNRDYLVENAMAIEPDYILFLDDDQTYPADTPERLMKYIDSGKMIVGGITPRKEDCTPMIWDYLDEARTQVARWKSINGRKGLVKVGGMGMGGVMIHPEVFRKIDAPYFKMQNDNQHYKRYGEDIAFYTKCKEKDIYPWADLDLQYGHTTMREVKIGDSPR